MSEAFDLYWDRGWEFYKAENFEEAIAEWRAAGELDPEDGYVLNNIGRALSKLGREEEAITEWRRAVQLEPDYHRPQTNLAYALTNKGFSLESLGAVQAAIRLSPNDVNLYNRLGYCLNEQACESKDQAGYEAAAKAFQQALNIDPTNSHALHSLGIVKWNLGKKQEAIKMQKAAMAADSNNVEIYLKLWEYQCRTRQFWDAIQTSKAMNRLPETERVDQYFADAMEALWPQLQRFLLTGTGLAAVLVGVWIWNRRRR